MMNKLLKTIKSRFFISGIVILLEFILLLVVFIFLIRHSIIIAIMSYIFYIGIFLYIINKNETPENKLPWIIIVMLLFVVGAFIYMLLCSNNQNKDIVAKFKKNKQKLKPYLQDETLEILKNENLDAYLQANYINNTTGLPSYDNTKVDYYKIGEEYYNALIMDLEKSEHFIFMEYFIIDEGKMWNPIYDILKQKVSNGVKVYLMYDDFGCMATLDETYYKKLTSEGINCIPSNKLQPEFSKIYNNRDHRKITVIDGKIGYTGGINIADEYINEKVRFGHWKDTGIRLEGKGVKNLTALFLEMWNMQNKKTLELEEFMNIEYKDIKIDGIVCPYGDGPVDFYKDSIGKNVYLNMLNSARNYVYITTPYLICDNQILNALCTSAKKGVDVRIITPHIPDKKLVLLMTQSNYKTLIDSGVKIYEYTPGFIHAKQFICDDIYAICGTINLDYRSLVHHFECGVWMYKMESIQHMKNDFLETQNISLEITGSKAKLKGLKRLLTEIMKIFFPLF